MINIVEAQSFLQFSEFFKYQSEDFEVSKADLAADIFIPPIIAAFTSGSHKGR